MKLKIFSVTVCLFLMGIIQSTVLEYLRFYHVKPNLLIVFVICYAFVRGNVEGAAVGFFAGLIQDIASGKVIGLYSLLGLYLGLIIGSINRRLFKENFFLALFFTFAASIIYESLVYLLSRIPDGTFNVWFALKQIILPEAVYNSIACVFIFILTVKLHRRFQNSESLPRKY